MSDGAPLHKISAEDAYQIDSDEYDSEASVDDLGEAEYERLAEEGAANPLDSGTSC